MKRVFLFSILFFICIPAITVAVKIPDIYIAELETTDKSKETLKNNLSQAFSQVLLKITGNSSIMTLPIIQNATSNINNYVVSYNYFGNENQKQLVLHVVFSPHALKELLKNSGQTFWNADRPLTLIWLSLPEKMPVSILSSDDSSDSADAIKKFAKTRAIPIIFPTMDMEDQKRLSEITSTLPDLKQLQDLAQHYGVSCILAGAILNRENEAIESQWRLYLNGSIMEWQTNGANTEQTLMNGMERALDMLVTQLGIIESKGLQSIIDLHINDVHNLKDYAQVLDEIKNMTPVSEVTVRRVSENRLTLRIKLSGGVDVLSTALNTSEHFVAETSAETELGNYQLFYRWKGTAPPS